MLVTLAVVLIALVLRSPVVAVAPVVDVLSVDLGLTPTVAGLLTSLPVLCFAVFAPLATLLTNRAGTPFAVTACALLIAIGCVVRSLDGTATLFLGTVVIGIAIAIGNIVLPVVIRREFTGRRAKVMSGVYTSVLNVGSMVATLATAPLTDAVGWRIAIAVWMVVALAGVVAVSRVNGWRPMVVPTRVPHGRDASGALPPSAIRNPTVWLLTLGFAGQAFAYYGITAWLPTLLRDEEGYSAAAAGGISAIFQVCAIIGAFLVPAIANRFSDRVAIAVIGTLWLITPLGFLVAPQLWWLWCVLGGAAQGGGFTAVFIIIVQLGRSDRHVGSISGLVQGLAYVVGAAGPTVIGAVHQVTGGWSVPLLIVLGAAATYGVAASIAAARASRPTA